MTAKTDRGEKITVGSREYWEIGLDLDGTHRFGAWEIKEIIDLSIPPHNTVKERFMAELPEGTKSATVEVKLNYHPSKKITLEVHKVEKKVVF